MNIKIKDYAQDDSAMSYIDGKRCLQDILKVIDSEPVTLDFDGVHYVITAFLNPIIGDLILQRGAAVMRKIEIQNATEATIMKIKTVKDGALVKREDMQE